MSISRKISVILLLLLSGLFLQSPATAQKISGHVDLYKLAQQNGYTVFNRELQPLKEGNFQGIRLVEKEAGAGVAWLKTGVFSQGTLEFDARGKDVLQRSFLGIAFHGVDDGTYDAIYFRPFNFRAEDPVRHRHAVQYISLPKHDWPVLRKEFPDQYENAINPAPDPSTWFHVLIVVEKESINVFVNHNTSPSLTVKKLNDRPDGRIGLWVGAGSGGDFANLKIKLR